MIATPVARQANIRLRKAEDLAIVYARLALAAAFFSAVASRFGLWDRTFDYAHFRNFIQYTAEVNSFLPRSIIPAVAWSATIAETSLAIALLLGLWLRWTALASAALLACFATAMAISQGIKSPFDYSVFSASSGALLLALLTMRRESCTG